MSPTTGDVVQTPEPKSTSGFASVFKSLTGNRSHKNPNPSAPIIQNGISAVAPTALYLQSTTYGGPPDYERLYTQLKPGNAQAERLAAAEALRHAVQDYPLTSVTSIFKQGKDLIESNNSRETRLAGFELLTACVRQTISTDPERLFYFRVLTAPANSDDFHLQLASVVELAKNGKDLSGFHYETLPLLTSWLKHNFSATATARSKAGRSNRSSKSKAPLGEETNLSLLFAFIVDVIKFSFSVSSEETTCDLIEVILYICVNTPITGDLKACIDVINAIITYGDIPGAKLMDCVKVICSIHCLVPDVQLEAWRCISNLCKSHNGQKTIRILLDILREPPVDSSSGKQMVREIRGALSVLEKMFVKDGKDGYPLVPFTLLIAALEKAVEVDDKKVENESLRLILSLFSDENEEVKRNVMNEDWSIMFDVITKCSRRALENTEGHSHTSRYHVNSLIATEDITSEQYLATSLVQTLHSIVMRIEELLKKFSTDDFFQKEDCIKFFVTVHPHLPESCAKLVIHHYMEYRYCYPSDLEWKENTRMILSAFFTDRTQPTDVRLYALKIITDVFEVIEMMDEHEDPDTIQVFVMSILNDIGDEKDIAILQKVVAFAVTVAEKADDMLFDHVIAAMRSTILSDRIQSPLGSPPSSRQGLMTSSRPVSSTVPDSLVQTPSNVVTRGLILIFMRTMDSSNSKALRIYRELLWISNSHECETDARISALKMLSRLRADWANGIFLTPFTESDALAATLYRTPAALARKQAIDEAAQQQRSSRVDDNARILRSTSVGQGHPTSRQPLRSASGLTRTMQRHHPQMWMCPDYDALPEPASGKASLELKSCLGANVNDNAEVNGDDEKSEPEISEKASVSGVVSFSNSQTVLNVGLYLETIISLMKNGCDWEVYSYILVHLASQLTNQALFVGAIPQIRTLRELLCDQIKNSTYYDPPLSSGLRKADVAICIFQILNMVMSYHRHFSKADQDEIVRTFLQGVGEKTSKSCIHALSICCHELPGSTSKSLVHILQKMSQIITQSHVAVHILEFLACLARLPDLYVNFREEEYRIVFAICFRYLQYARDQQAKETSNRHSNPLGRSSMSSPDPRGQTDSRAAESNFEPNTSDDLPQYVYALAYHVIIFWFLALKLPDRAGQVTWIIRNLVSTDINGKEKIDEQAQVTLDFMQRVAYADVDESDADPSFTEEVFGQIQKKRWIIGNSLVTVEQATRGDWAQITKRQPSGTSCYIIQEKFIRPPPHQDPGLADIMKDGRLSDDNVKLPSHLMLQLSASIPQGSDATRPIPLPNNEDMERAVKGFNRLFTVDGHKVGVIYIGENQTNEIEILSNIQGSSDYTEFLSGLGTLTKLQGAKFNTQGLDKEYDSDGKYTFCWRDRVTEIVFHVTTQMPTNLDRDSQCIGKKRHIGNDFVNIIFNNSGLPFKFDTFPSQFNYVNIVITPESRASFVATRFRSKMHANDAFYKVQVMSKPGFPEVSPASEIKIMSLAALPGFIRLLALNASVFSLVWSNRDGVENVSSWRSRLHAINRIRERYTPKSSTSSAISPPGTSNGVNIRDSISSLRRSSVANFLTGSTAPEAVSQRSSILSTAETEVGPVTGEENLVESLDFSKWA
ncbi:related to TUBERIN [Rhynchosporium agropyri]|uniref:Related to TUBERIN n=1 Tax=Rhynchosporium agropyri TaxID=914238 RepID=A0A1E1LIY8_9HELO|nr:related to TUBERIN [Rhynchosporium agropyri]